MINSLELFVSICDVCFDISEEAEAVIETVRRDQRRREEFLALIGFSETAYIFQIEKARAQWD